MPASSLVVDAGPLLGLSRDELKSMGESLYTTPAVYGEIKDESARARLQLLGDELKIKQPSQHSIQFVREFAKKTGDYSVLSTADIAIIALAYELHDKTGLRSAPQTFEPGMDVVEHEHGSGSAAQDDNEKPEDNDDDDENEDDGWETIPKKSQGRNSRSRKNVHQRPKPSAEPEQSAQRDAKANEASPGGLETRTETTENDGQQAEDDNENREPLENIEEDDEDDWDNEEGWITPANLEQTARKERADASHVTPETGVSAALASRDFAVQNVAMQIGLPLLDNSGLRITQLRTYMQRCHACFTLIMLARDGRPRQFCPQCGGHTLTRVTVSIENGVVHVHLKAGMQWKTRGDRYSIPNPQSRRARRLQHDNQVELYAEDQPEYMKAVKKAGWQQRRNEKIMEDWIGPGTGDSGASPFAAKREMKGHVRVGRGRNANVAKKGSV